MDASQANLVRGRLQMQFAQILAPPATRCKQIPLFSSQRTPAPTSVPSVLNLVFSRFGLKTRSRFGPPQNKNANAFGSRD
jgi:hypothetical protein